MAEQQLPEEFRDLEPFIGWALEKERQRTEKRVASTMEEVRAFYGAVFPRIEAIVAYLDRFPYDALPAPAQRLFQISHSLVEVANLVERYKRREVIEAVSPLKFASAQ